MATHIHSNQFVLVAVRLIHYIVKRTCWSQAAISSSPTDPPTPSPAIPDVIPSDSRDLLMALSYSGGIGTFKKDFQARKGGDFQTKYM